MKDQTTLPIAMLSKPSLGPLSSIFPASALLNHTAFSRRIAFLRVTSPKSQALGGGGSSFLTNVGASLLFFGTKSSFSDSLVSRFPRTLPLTELGRLLIIPNGVCGGVVHGRPLKDEFGAVTLGTFPNVGVGLFPTICDD